MLLLSLSLALASGLSTPAPLSQGSVATADPSQAVRSDAAAALARILDPSDAAGALQRRELTRIVVESLDPETSLVLEATALVADPDPVIQGLAIGFMARPDLGDLARPERVRALSTLVSPRSGADARVIPEEARSDAIAALGRIGDRFAAEVLAAVAVKEPDAALRVRAATALVEAPGGDTEIVRLVRSLVDGGLFAEGASRGSAAPDADVLAVLLPRYGQWLGDANELSTLDLMPLVVGLKAPEEIVRAAAGDAFQEALDRLAASEVRGRAAELLQRLTDLGISRDVTLYQSARIALSAEGDAGAALRAAQALTEASGLQLGGELRLDAYESQLWVFRGRYLAGLAELALGHVEDAERSFELAASALDAALSERRDLLAESERLVHVDLLHQRAVLEIARALAFLVRSDAADPASLGPALERARTAHERHLEAQAVYAEIRGDVMTGWDALLGSDMSVYQIFFGRRGFASGGGPRLQADGSKGGPLDRARIVELQGRLGRVLASVSPGELPGFALLEPAGPPEVVERLTDPLADPARRRYLDRIRAARLSGIDDAIDAARQLMTRAQERAFGIIPEPEIQALENLQRRRFAARQAAEEANRSTDRQWMRDLRIPGSAALWHAQDLKEEGRGTEARVIATRLEADLTDDGISDWWFVIGHERIVRAQLLAGSAFTDEGRGEEAERVLLRAVERIEDIERDLAGRGATFDDLSSFRALRSTALVSLAVNANVRLLDKDKALGYYERAYELRKDEFMRVLMACYRARSGAEAEARSLLRSIRPGPGTWYNLACTHALLGDTSRALDYLETELMQNHASVESANRQREWAANDPDLASLRNEARFQRLVRVL
ncbi:hypothetical protein Poly30_41630 [Planctomycetes bacterium Poly30]|uniref:Tetratricopeptide repeat protein n=1 Tax=Saltatorellus ferox TaxID=2528018 RepID=A0A518EWZ4_9BACT|nr:hypothetical protein Poly30_41630 [Planctomycetes bacterium Poly30]